MKKNKFGPNIKEDEYEIYKNSKRPVRLHMAPSRNVLGIIEKYSLEFIYLKPSLTFHESYRLDGTLIDNVVIENELPQKVKKASVIQIEPLRKGYLDALAQNLNYNAHPPKIIHPK